jgi:transcriptional regulator of arginine metabolism
MRERSSRIASIKRIIAANGVASQERLIELLRKEGFAVTQATLSRDLKALGIAKVPDAGGGYAYTLPEPDVKPGRDATFIQDFTRGYVSMEFSGRFGLMKTLPGHASSVAAALDGLRIAEVLGTIAGDDTILVVPRNGVARQAMLAAMKKRLPGL